ncbi:amino acid aminotransferase [Pontibacter diazotrophicus]|uniref:branched-chain-amino-acid transaminase n=1 Tax=Pontibacter diazotrophicus TaxID=1400979 RepID=A0A3D8L128_9BACT|nr:aminotransferase class IV [Pontibacter diazotrophicus]RDV11076.1 amino acid aminotransferase [Pontibacter diazotrophicus]
MSSENKLHAFVRGEIVPLDQAYLHVSDLSIQRGYGVFDFLKIINGRPLFLEDYLARFYASATRMHLAVPLSEDALKTTIYRLIELNRLPMAGMKIILTGGYSDSGYDIGDPSLLIIQQPLRLPGQALRERGLKVITHDYVREVPTVKTINYSMGIRLINKIKENGADDVLYHREGLVTEFPRCNFFIVKQDGTVVTPAEDVLRGITRKHVLELAGRTYKVVEGAVTLDDIRQASEAFLTSTTKRILPVVQVDDVVIGNGKPGAVTLSLLQDLIQLEEREA